MNIKKHIPNTITLGNLFCGCLALMAISEGQYVSATYFVGIALILDFFDGFTARLLKVASPIGKDLDSLADMVTFGVVPGMMMCFLIGEALPFDVWAKMISWHDYPNDIGGKPSFVYYPKKHELVLPYLGFIITIFSCIRLAKFNNDTRQSDSFIGVPTPANTMVICSIPLITEFQPELAFSLGFLSNFWFLLALTVAMSFLLIAELPLFALKFKNFSWSDNKVKYLFLLVSVALIVALKFVAIPLVILLYILISIVNNIFSKKQV